VSEPGTPQDRLPTAEEAFAERVAPLLELVERWRARIGTEAGRWPAVPLPGLEPDDPRRLASEIAEELLRARGHLVAAEERVRSAAALRRRMLGEPAGEPGP
jgi:outer membrane protein TolC